MPTEEGQDLIDLTREICDKELRPTVDAAERAAATDESFPTEVFRTLGAAGLLSLPHPEEFGGYGQPYEVYLQVVEEIASAWMSVAVGVSVHSLTAYPVTTFGTPEQQAALLPDMLSGEPARGLLPVRAAGRLRRRLDDDPRGRRGRQRRRAHGIPAARPQGVDQPRGPRRLLHDLRPHDRRRRARACPASWCPPTPPGLSFGTPERKMGLHCDTVREVMYDDVPVEAARRIGGEGQGMAIALSALDAGRLGIAAAATGLAQSALDLAASYAKERQQFGRPIAANQGLAFLVADMEAAVTSARATYLHAARLKDAGRAFSKEAAVAKLVATDAAMKVTTDAVQVLGGAGYTQDFPAERFMREAKVTQIFEGTNQIQRLVISRHVLRLTSRPAGTAGSGPASRCWQPRRPGALMFTTPRLAVVLSVVLLTGSACAESSDGPGAGRLPVDAPPPRPPRRGRAARHPRRRRPVAASPCRPTCAPARRRRGDRRHGEPRGRRRPTRSSSRAGPR